MLLTSTGAHTEAERKKQVRMNIIRWSIANPALWNELVWVLEVLRQS